MRCAWEMEDCVSLRAGSYLYKALEILAGVSKEPEQQNGGIKPSHMSNKAC